MPKKKVFIFLFLLFLLGVMFLPKMEQGKIEKHYFYPAQSSFELDLPLPKPADISTEKNKIRLDLEQIAVHRYFIIYSVIYGDQSHSAYHLFLTDLDRKKLNPSGIGEIYLQTKEGEKILPVAEEPVISGFPADQPLGWKLAIIVKFPYAQSREEHNLYLEYQGQLLELAGISY